MARDQQFLTQQMAFMRDMMKKSDNDGFFDGEMKGIFKEKMVDQLLGNNEGGAIERVASKLLNSDVLSAVATGASAMAAKRKSWQVMMYQHMTHTHRKPFHPNRYSNNRCFNNNR